MLTIKKRGLLLLSVLTATLLTACGPAGPRALTKGERLMAAGKTTNAIPKFEEATRLLAKDSPENQAQAWNWLGLALHNTGQIQGALDAYTKAAQLDRNLAAAKYNLGYLLFDQRNYPGAIDAWNTYLALKPGNAEGKEAEVLFQIGTAHLRQAALSSGAEKNRQLDQARKNLEASMKLSQDPETLNQLGVVIFQRNRSAVDALAKFKQALRIRPNYPPALLNMAIIHHQNVNERRTALQEYQEYLALKPTPANAKEVEAVANALARDLAPQPPSSSAKPAATNMTATAENAPETPESAAKTPQNSPEPPPPALKTIFTATNTAKNALSEAKPTEPAVARYNYPTFAQPTPGNRDEALRLTRQGQTKQKTSPKAAIEAYQNAIKADPSYFEAYYYLSSAQRENGDMSASLDTLNRAINLRPDSVETRYAFAWSLQKSKYPQDAVNELEKILKQNPNDVRAHLLTANIYSLDLHQPNQARPHYQKVLELNPSHPQAAVIRTWLAANP